MLLSAPGTAEGAAFRVARTGFTSVIDLTHGRALMRLSGADSHRLLAKLCSIDLADHMAPNGAAFRATIAKLVTDIIRDDIDSTPSYLLHCETSSGQYLFDTLLDAGDEYGIDVDGFGVDPGLTLPDEDVRSLRLAD
jgi:heterotetrameric sarcosine oxidase gamma subunit